MSSWGEQTANHPTSFFHSCNKFLQNSYYRLAFMCDTGATAGWREWCPLMSWSVQAVVNHTLLQLCLSGLYIISTNTSSLKQLIIIIFHRWRNWVQKNFQDWAMAKQVLWFHLYPMEILFCFVTQCNSNFMLVFFVGCSSLFPFLLPYCWASLYLWVGSFLTKSPFVLQLYSETLKTVEVIEMNKNKHITMTKPHTNIWLKARILKVYPHQ